MRFLHLLFIVTFFLGIAAAQPTVNTNGVVNSSNYSINNPKGSLVTIFGTNMATTGKLLVASSTPLSMELQGGSDTISVTINGTPAPIYYATSTQSSVQVPWEITAGTANIVVMRNGQKSQPQSFHATTFSPGIFTTNQQGTGMAWAIYACAPGSTSGCPAPAKPSVAQPPQGWPFASITAVPAQAGDRLYLYATGLGPVNPTIADGAAPCALAGCVAGDTQRKTTTLPQVTIGGVQAKVTFSGLAPQFPGVYQVNFTVPTGVTPGNAVPIQIATGSPLITTANNVTIAIQ